MTSAQNRETRAGRWRAFRSALVLATVLAPWLLSVVIFEAFLDFALEATRLSGGSGVRGILSRDLRVYAQQGAMAACLSCILLVANSLWRWRRGASTNSRPTVAAIAAFYAAVMTHRAFLLADGIPTPDVVREAFPVRIALFTVGAIALFTVGAIAIIASTGLRRRRGHTSLGEGAVEIVACLVGLATLYPLLGHGQLMEGWFAHEPPFCARGIEPLELPATADRTANRFGVWRDGVYNPYPDPSAPPWAFALRGAEVAPSGSREFLPIGDPRIWDEGWRERRLDFPEIAAVAERRLRAGELEAFLRTLYPEPEYTTPLTVHGPIEGSLSCDEVARLRWALPWVAPLGMVQGKVELYFDRRERERSGDYVFTRIGRDDAEYRRPGSSEPLLRTTREEMLRDRMNFSHIRAYVIEFDDDTTAAAAIELALELRNEGFFPILVAANSIGTP